MVLLFFLSFFVVARYCIKWMLKPYDKRNGKGMVSDFDLGENCNLILNVILWIITSQSQFGCGKSISKIDDSLYKIQTTASRGDIGSK